jgi:hypothetical protein
MPQLEITPTPALQDVPLRIRLNVAEGSGLPKSGVGQMTAAVTVRPNDGIQLTALRDAVDTKRYTDR